MTTTPTPGDLAYLLAQGCDDEAHARRAFAALHADPRRVNLYPAEKRAAITATRERPAAPHPDTTVEALAAEARRRYADDVVFHARVDLAAQVARATSWHHQPPADGPDWLRTGAALALVISDRVTLGHTEVTSADDLVPAATRRQLAEEMARTPIDRDTLLAAFPQLAEPATPGTTWQEDLAAGRAADAAHLAAQADRDAEWADALAAALDHPEVDRADHAGEWVRATYRVPAHKGRRVLVDGHRPGTVAGFTAQYVVVAFDQEDGHEERRHPTWQLEYLEPGQ